MISVVVGGEVGMLRSIEEGCGVVIDEMPIHVRPVLPFLSCPFDYCCDTVLHSCYPLSKFKTVCLFEVFFWMGWDVADLGVVELV